MGKFFVSVLAAGAVALVLGACASTGRAGAAGVVTSLPKIDMSRWSYNAADDVYYQTGISYVAHPADTSYETLGIYVPGAYFEASANGDGTYTARTKAGGKAGSYTVRNAPTVIPVETPGYSACKPPSGYTADVKAFTDAGFIYLFAGCRGRTEGAPAGVTDLKAAIRYWRYNADILPGSSERIFSFGMSGGGAQSALLGATGNSALYEPYLKAIGAVEGVSDAVTGSMCWCPITNLDIADAAYEWNMGASRSGLSETEQMISDKLAASFAAYINSIALVSEKGVPLTLEASADGRWQAGSYYDYTKALIEDSLAKFLSDTEFPYNPSQTQKAGMGGPGGFGGMPQGMPPMGMPGGNAGNGGYEQRDNIQRNNAAGGGLTLNGSYDSPQAYIDALNVDGTWVSYDAKSGRVSITSIADFAKKLKTASKSVGAFDDLNAQQGENVLFGYGSGAGAHFDKYLADIVKGTKYESAYSSDLKRSDKLGFSVQARLDMYTPLYYLNKTFGGYKSADVAKHWRIRSGIFQGDTAVCTEMNLALALRAYGIKDVDFEAVWGQKHVKAERQGDSTQNFISWVNDCLK